METAVVCQAPAFTLQGWSHWDHRREEVSVSWDELKAAKPGDKWEARDPSNFRRGSENQEAVVVYKDDNGVAVLHRTYGFTNDERPSKFVSLELVWYEFTK
jgi:hypothetical protein